ncbi:MAG: LysR family transcriptional regulator [Christensenellales bacterium]|jgi:DNA-binding transcriptional LysR family regulator
MDDRHMTIFLAVCDCGGVTGAAKALYLAQPAVSLAIKELEAYYGVRLFDRIGRRLSITPAGEQFLSYARHITALFDEAKARMQRWEQSGEVRVGASITIGTCRMPGWVAAFAQRCPDTRVRVTVDNSEVIEGLIQKNQLDLAVIEGVAHQQTIAAEPFDQDELALVCGARHPLAGETVISPQTLAAQPLLLRERGSGTRELFDSALMTQGLRVTPLWESISTEAILQALKANLGLSALPMALVERDLAEGTLKRLRVEGISFARSLYIIHHREKYLTQAAQNFIALCRQSA